ncbi:Hypothetical predicted protein [Marmota monax]|uniref:Uncharacterized protein n=1 Tax=Marmota monax TaxID=9995 RepID=A0A5E4AAU7_MARMO|nr:hypothetical protein GHT09_000663 [Marmota monax]KAF7486979.1 hypothetical protein GHT09_000663 [Marmota monax]KAF7486980.1 hypothetical protein GHT09_000663 [Marmota monax]KAF7486981.1 hypothetical protein GHT09_000663 [Marmota monax]KAF7486982.1 hypothetical protein GHT09_000663 [Marmota monax]
MAVQGLRATNLSLRPLPCEGGFVTAPGCLVLGRVASLRREHTGCACTRHLLVSVSLNPRALGTTADGCSCPLLQETKGLVTCSRSQGREGQDLCQRSVPCWPQHRPELCSESPLGDRELHPQQPPASSGGGPGPWTPSSAPHLSLHVVAHLCPSFQWPELLPGTETSCRRAAPRVLGCCLECGLVLGIQNGGSRALGGSRPGQITDQPWSREHPWDLT